VSQRTDADACSVVKLLSRFQSGSAHLTQEMQMYIGGGALLLIIILILLFR
jgi:hypothetical protein